MHYRPSVLEIYFGPMKSGKTRALMDRLDKISFTEYKTLVARPACDTRTIRGIEARPIIDPQELLKERYDIIAIDEVQLFSSEIVEVIKQLLAKGTNVLVAGLNLDFRGEPFGPMPLLLSYADRFYPLTAVCDKPGCNSPATRTQRLIDGRPAPYDAPLISIEGTKQEETYEARCMKHHEVRNV
ncbi:MAG: thymidine kinase [Candidatus Woesearchaeota archaeon]